MAKKILSVITILLASLLITGTLTGCGADPPRSETEARSEAMTDTAASETYTVTGRVMSVTPDRDFLMVRHDEVEGFMEAMTMPFPVRDTAVVSGVAAGDSVAFVIEVARGEAVITSLERR